MNVFQKTTSFTFRPQFMRLLSSSEGGECCVMTAEAPPGEYEVVHRSM